ncbi:transposase [Klebsiella pneumoniae]|uniref:transposase n=1 Tax=Klebsiella pneumoniae TaxID=573 RepID=UPI0022CE014E|nr:transposase [Klebsiella pneumoniae]
MNVPLRCPDYTSVSKRAKSVNISFKTFTRGEIAHLVIDSTGLKVFGEGEWKVKKHGKERRRIWRKCIWQLTAKHMKSSVQTCR